MVQESQETEDLRQRRLRDFEDHCTLLGGTPWREHGIEHETERHCTVEPVEIILRVPRDSFFGSLVVQRTGQKLKYLLGVIFEQGRGGTVTYNVV
jgi:hypothetical protein